MNNAGKLNKAQKKKQRRENEKAQLGDETEFYGFDKEERKGEKEFKAVERVSLRDGQSLIRMIVLTSFDVALTVAMEPPTLNLKKGQEKLGGHSSRMPVSMSQKEALERQRLIAIERCVPAEQKQGDLLTFEWCTDIEN